MFYGGRGVPSPTDRTMATARPTFQYSEKALRQLQGAPAQDCGTHPDTYYVRVPEPLRERVGHDWACRECLKVLQTEAAGERQRARTARQTERLARKAARTQARDEAAIRLDALVMAVDQGLGEVKTVTEEHTREVEARAVAMADVTVATTAVVKAEAALLAARQKLAKEKRRLTDAKARVAAPINGGAYVVRMQATADQVEGALASFDTALDLVKGSAAKKLLGKHGGRAAMKKAGRIIRDAREWLP